MRTNRTLRMALANGVVALVFLLGAGAAQAATVLCGVDIGTAMPCGEFDNNAIGIRNLDLPLVPGADPRGYNVEFRFDVAADAFTEPLTFTTSAQAIGAANQVADLFNTSFPDIVRVNQLTAPLENKTFFDIPYEFALPDGLRIGSARFVSGGWAEDPNPGLVGTLELSSFAIFTVVPEPGTAALLGLGLAGLGVVGRSRREESEGTA